MTVRPLFILPLLVFMVLAGYFAVGLTKDPRQLPDMLTGSPVPAFDLSPLKGRDTQGFASTDLVGGVSLVNVFGSWCVACRLEHGFLMHLKATGAVPVHGIDWREVNADAGPDWLRQNGDPYTLVGDDPHSRAAIAFGVTGAPETFVVDALGIIRYKQIGPLNEKIWQDVIAPILSAIRAEGKS